MKKFILTAVVLSPVFAFAQLGDVTGIVVQIRNIVNIAIPVVGGLVLLAFFWGLMKFVFSAGDPEQKEDGKKLMINGVIALFIMASIWGIVAFIARQFNIQTDGTQSVPTVNL